MNVNSKKIIVSWAFLFGSLFISLYVGLTSQFNPGISSIFVAAFMTVCICLQYLFPVQKNIFEKNEITTDFLFFAICTIAFSAVSSFFVQKISMWLAPGLFVKIGLLGVNQGFGTFPLALQIVLFVLLIDLGYYWTHRISHSSSVFFRFHRIHHAPHRVSVLNGSRVHPIDSLWRRAVPMIFAVQFGFDKVAVAAGVQVMIVAGIVQHMNVGFKFGLLNRVLGTNEAHRWHHSDKPTEALNYGLLSIWDQVWGTFYVPSGRLQPESMGLAEPGARPLHNFFWQIIDPFIPTRLAGSTHAAERSQKSKWIDGAQEIDNSLK